MSLLQGEDFVELFVNELFEKGAEHLFLYVAFLDKNAGQRFSPLGSTLRFRELFFRNRSAQNEPVPEVPRGIGAYACDFSIAERNEPPPPVARYFKHPRVPACGHALEQVREIQ